MNKKITDAGSGSEKRYFGTFLIEAYLVTTKCTYRLTFFWGGGSGDQVVEDHLKCFENISNFFFLVNQSQDTSVDVPLLLALAFIRHAYNLHISLVSLTVVVW